MFCWRFNWLLQLSTSTNINKKFFSWFHVSCLCRSQLCSLDPTPFKRVRIGLGPGWRSGVQTKPAEALLWHSWPNVFYTSPPPNKSGKNKLEDSVQYTETESESICIRISFSLLTNLVRVRSDPRRSAIRVNEHSIQKPRIRKYFNSMKIISVVKVLKVCQFAFKDGLGRVWNIYGVGAGLEPQPCKNASFHSLLHDSNHTKLLTGNYKQCLKIN